MAEWQYARPSLHMPPEEVWVHHPDRDGRLPTPIDERNLVNLDALVELVKGTVEPGYEWNSSFFDVHHLHWTAALYTGSSNRDTQELRDFRNLASRKAYVPRQFHNWVHRVTEPSPLPERDVIRYSIDAERVALSLAETAMLASRMQRNPRFSDELRKERLKVQFEQYCTYVDNARLVPEEFQRVPLSLIEIDQPEELPVVARHLGRLALNRIPERRRGLVAA